MLTAHTTYAKIVLTANVDGLLHTKTSKRKIKTLGGICLAVIPLQKQTWGRTSVERSLTPF
jgi:hypothetical protein